MLHWQTLASDQLVMNPAWGSGCVTCMVVIARVNNGAGVPGGVTSKEPLGHN